MRPRCRRRQRGFTLDTSERMTQTQPRRPRDERGVSLLEVMVGLVMLTTALLALATAAGLALRTTARAGEDLQLWAAAQWTADSLVSMGAGNVVNGSGVVQGRTVSWTVSGTDPQRIDLVVDRRRMTDLVIVKDTLVLYLTN